MKNLNIVLLAISGLFLVSCESSTMQDISAVVTNPTYNSNVASVMSAKCTSCHGGGNQSPNLETYAEVKDATQNGSLLCKIEGSCGGEIMPPDGALPQATITMINTWATNNFPEN
jgi:cytochrome c5